MSNLGKILLGCAGGILLEIRSNQELEKILDNFSIMLVNIEGHIWNTKLRFSLASMFFGKSRNRLEDMSKTKFCIWERI